MSTTDQVVIDVENILNILVAYGLQLNAALTDYFGTNTTTLDVTSYNILTQSLNYLNDADINGFSDTEKNTNLQTSYFAPVNVILIIECGLFCILIVAFIYYICSLFGLENFYLKRLIKFKNPPFEAYLKKLEDIKKKLRNDNGEDDDKFNNDLDMQDFNNSKRGSKHGDDDDHHDNANPKTDKDGKGQKGEEEEKGR